MGFSFGKCEQGHLLFISWCPAPRSGCLRGRNCKAKWNSSLKEKKMILVIVLLAYCLIDCFNTCVWELWVHPMELMLCWDFFFFSNYDSYKEAIFPPPFSFLSCFLFPFLSLQPAFFQEFSGLHQAELEGMCQTVGIAHEQNKSPPLFPGPKQSTSLL